MTTNILSKILFLIIGVSGLISCSSNKNTLKNSLVKQYDNNSYIQPFVSIEHVRFDVYEGTVYTVDKIEENKLTLKVSKDGEINEMTFAVESEYDLTINDIESISVDNRILAILVDIHTEYQVEYIYIFDLKNRSLIKKQKLENTDWEYIYHRENLIYFCRCYNYNDKTQKDKFVFEICDIASLELIKSKIIDLNGIHFTHFSNVKPFDINTKTKQIIYSDINQISLKLLDSNLNEISYISHIPKYWSTKYLSELENINDTCKTMQAYQTIRYLKELKSNGFAHVNQVGFLNDSTIIVSYFSGLEDIDENTAGIEIFVIRDNNLIHKQGDLLDVKSKTYLPIFYNMTIIPIYENNIAYFYSPGSYNAFLNMNTPLWLKMTASIITGSKIKMNLVELQYEDL